MIKKDDMLKVKFSNGTLSKKLVEVEKKEMVASVNINHVENWLRERNVEIKRIPVVGKWRCHWGCEEGLKKGRSKTLVAPSGGYEAQFIILGHNCWKK